MSSLVVPRGYVDESKGTMDDNKMIVKNKSSGIAKNSFTTPPNMSGIPFPHPHDVLSGRGSLTNLHIGNINFRQLVEYNKKRYAASIKQQKIIVSKSIVKAIRNQDPPGRFLQFDSSTGLWNEIGDARALSKTSQTLRETPTIHANLIESDFVNNSDDSSKKVESDNPSDCSKGTSQGNSTSNSSSVKGQLERESLAPNKMTISSESEKMKSNLDFLFFCQNVKTTPCSNTSHFAQFDAMPPFQNTPHGDRQEPTREPHESNYKSILNSIEQNNLIFSRMARSNDIPISIQNSLRSLKRPSNDITLMLPPDVYGIQGPSKRTKLPSFSILHNGRNSIRRRFCQRSSSSSKFNPFRRHLICSQDAKDMVHPKYQKYFNLITEPVYQNHAARHIENDPSLIRPIATRKKSLSEASTKTNSSQLQPDSAVLGESVLCTERNVNVELNLQTKSHPNNILHGTQKNNDVSERKRDNFEVPLKIHSNPDVGQQIDEAGDRPDSTSVWYKNTLKLIQAAKDMSVSHVSHNGLFPMENSWYPDTHGTKPLLNDHFPFSSLEANPRCK